MGRMSRGFMEDTVLGLLSGEKALRLEPRLWSHFFATTPTARSHTLELDRADAALPGCFEVPGAVPKKEPLLPWRGAHHFEHREHVEFLSASRNIPGVGRPGRDGLRQPKCFEIT
jgi:hypothetical protein